MPTEKSPHLELANVSRCINEAMEKLRLQQSKVEQAALTGQSVHEERGRLIIMVEAFEMMTKRRAELFKSP
jgi:hypothetical protein